ncbi:hypothetical protein AM493_13640 [Flavobacterium akiainvivens]|uniref:Uncharacterized protein n=1 Tax=Flavobacterium akiainvivens TaxID=1202724 RepID=A0A0M8MJQ5_9FLAO|nr:hypothetical protein [Flavobacterium akiainvivens]KOS06958.1 hypothetical protein AM493_13640 [Flavobacterium akiainvivens]SFQ60020.1 hypothetical protein SAMN05444144_109152 [Flavobacterium akiainvivens]
MKTILSLIAALCCLTCFSQKDKTVIKVEYNPQAYRKIALDTLKYMFDAQKRVKPVKKDNYHYFVQDTTQFENLDIKVIPVFRIITKAFSDYSCDKNIEDYILFEERYKYLVAKVTDTNGWSGDVDIPDVNYETERFYPGEWVYADSDSEPYYYIKKLKFWTPDLDQDYEKEMNMFPNRFYFKIWGLPQLLLYIDKKDSKVYGRYVGPCSCMYDSAYQTAEEFIKQNEDAQKTYPVNELVQKYAGPDQIRLAALGFCNPEYGNPGIKMEPLHCDGTYPEGRAIKLTVKE